MIQGLNKVNVTAFFAGMHPIYLKPMRLPKGSALNGVFTLDSNFFQDIHGLHERLFSYPQYRLADYRLATADGELNVDSITFCEFPFNLARGGKKNLWLFRYEDEDPAVDKESDISENCDRLLSAHDLADLSTPGVDKLMNILPCWAHHRLMD